jgi:predicted permease
MSAFITAFDAVLPLFLIILGGILFSRTKMASEQWVEILNRFALWIGFPALVITLLSRLDLSGGHYNRMMMVNSVYFIICTLLAFPYSRLFRFTRLRRRTFFLILAYGNVTYLGIPVLQTVLGDEGLKAGALLSAVYVFWLLTLGLLLVETGGDKPFHPGQLALKLLTNPLLLSVVIGLFLAITRLQLPGILSRSLSMVAQSVTPLVLFSLGIFMGFQKIGHLREWGHVFLFSLVIMLALPGIFYMVTAHTGWLKGMDLEASILEAAMPVGLTPYALAQQYRLDTAFTARVVLLSTSLSLVLLPLWIVILG